jgi:hypothetical protein
MTKLSLATILLVVAAGSVALYNYADFHVTVGSSDAEPQTRQPAPAANSSTEDMNKKRQEGIGSIKDLKPVQLAPEHTAPPKQGTQ